MNPITELLGTVILSDAELKFNVWVDEEAIAYLAITLPY
jgi:hypothetical protein